MDFMKFMDFMIFAGCLLDKHRDNYNCRPPILKVHIYRTWESKFKEINMRFGSKELLFISPPPPRWFFRASGVQNNIVLTEHHKISLSSFVQLLSFICRFYRCCEQRIQVNNCVFMFALTYHPYIYPLKLCLIPSCTFNPGIRVLSPHRVLSPQPPFWRRVLSPHPRFIPSPAILNPRFIPSAAILNPRFIPSSANPPRKALKAIPWITLSLRSRNVVSGFMTSIRPRAAWLVYVKVAAQRMHIPQFESQRI